MASRQQDFVESVYSAARAAGLDDVEARTAAAQAALETGYGRSMPGGNMFGIKSGPSWQGPSHVAQTWEVEGGVRRDQPASFRSYDDPMDSLSDWADVTSNRWGDVFSAETFPDAVAGLRAGQPGGYATDPNYAGKLGYIDRNFNDLKNYADAIPTGIPSVTPQARPDPQAMPETFVASAPAQPDSPFGSFNLDNEANSFAGSLMNSYAPVDTAPVSIAAQPTAQAGGIMSASLAQNAFDTQRAAPLTAPPTEIASAPQMAAPAGASAFDMGRFGPQPNMPSIPSTAQANLVGQPSISGMTGLTGPNFGAPSLLNASFTPSPLERPAAPAMSAPVDVSAPPAVAGVPGYTDPMVTTATPASPTGFGNQPARATSPTSANPTFGASLVGPPSADPLTAAAARQARGVNSLLDDVQSDRSRNAKIGGILGALAGGPIGGILGLGLAGAMSARSPQARALGAFPSAGTFMGNINQFIGRSDYSDVNGYGSLSAEGRDIYDSSSQVRDAVDAVDSGKSQGGLW